MQNNCRSRQVVDARGPVKPGALAALRSSFSGSPQATFNDQSLSGCLIKRTLALPTAA